MLSEMNYSCFLKQLECCHTIFLITEKKKYVQSVSDPETYLLKYKL